MNIRQAILKAADSIEKNPNLFDFNSVVDPSLKCGTPGCALGWIGFHLDMERRWGGGFRNGLDSVSEKIGMSDDQLKFYSVMDGLCGNYDWRKSADECARGLRFLADKYHPVQGIPDSVLAIFNQEVVLQPKLSLQDAEQK